MFLKEGFFVKVVLLPDGEDPDSYARSHDASEFMEYINQHQQDFIRFKAQFSWEQVSGYIGCFGYNGNSRHCRVSTKLRDRQKSITRSKSSRRIRLMH